MKAIKTIYEDIVSIRRIEELFEKAINKGLSDKERKELFEILDDNGITRK